MKREQRNVRKRKIDEVPQRRLQFETLLQWQALLFELDHPMSEADYDPAHQVLAQLHQG